MIDILSLSPEELRKTVQELGLPGYRSKQISEWLTRGCRDFSEMSNLPKSLRETLPEHFELTAPKMLRRQISKEDGTEKFLWGLKDSNSVETVFMRYHYGNSVCISSQVGCRQGCCFCASTIGGLVRNLTPGEMLDEVLFTEQEAGDRVSNIVLMGIGEPMDNLDNVLRSTEVLTAPYGLGWSPKRITVSTVGGLPEGIDRLADERLPVTLSLSLHAPEDVLRSKLMPSNRGIDTVLDACRRYADTTGRRVSFEYSMIRDTNDHPEQAAALAAHAKRIGAHVNLIPLNYVEERGLLPSEPSVIRAFQKTLEDSGVTVTVRRRLGSDIDASCGQLRRKYKRI